MGFYIINTILRPPSSHTNSEHSQTEPRLYYEHFKHIDAELKAVIIHPSVVVPLCWLQRFYFY